MEPIDHVRRVAAGPINLMTLRALVKNRAILINVIGNMPCNKCPIHCLQQFITAQATTKRTDLGGADLQGGHYFPKLLPWVIGRYPNRGGVFLPAAITSDNMIALLCILIQLLQVLNMLVTRFKSQSS